MLNLYSGTPGSGKSLHSAENIYYHLLMGRTVIANFDINKNGIKKGKYRGHFYYVPNDELTPEYLIQFSKDFFKNKKLKESQIFLYVDECQLLFNARDWNQKGRSQWLSFFTQHRHYGYDIYLIAQFDRMIDRQVRSLIEYEYKHRKVSNFGLFGLIVSILTLGQLFCCVKVWYPLKERVGVDFFKANKKYYSLYDTYAILDD